MKVVDILGLDLPESAVLMVRMSVREAAYLVQLIGGFSESSDPVVVKTSDKRWHHDQGGEIYDSLVGEFFNRFYEDGIKDYLRET